MTKRSDDLLKEFISNNWIQLCGFIITATLLFAGMRHEIDDVKEAQKVMRESQDAQSKDMQEMKADISDIKSIIGSSNVLNTNYEVSSAR